MVYVPSNMYWKCSANNSGKRLKHFSKIFPEFSENINTTVTFFRACFFKLKVYQNFEFTVKNYLALQSCTVFPSFYSGKFLNTQPAYGYVS